MNINPLKLMQMRESFDRFTTDHPKVVPFFQAVMNDGISEGTVIEIKVSNPQGKNYVSSIRVSAQDMEMLRSLSSDN